MPNKIAFATDRLLKLNCPPDLDRIYYHDSKTLGLALCVTRTKQKTFYLYRRVAGRPTRIRLGLFPQELSVDDARKEAAKANGDIAKGIDPRQAKRTARAEMTFGELWQDYHDKHVVAKCRPRTAKEYKRQYDGYLTAWKNKRLSEIDRSAVQSLHNHIGDKHGPYIANRILALVHALFEWGVKHFNRQRNPAYGVQRFAEQSRERFLRPEELPKFFAAVEADKPIFADFFKLAIFTGARRSNLQSMRWQDINHGVWTIPADASKNGKPMNVHLCAEAAEILKRRLAERDGNSSFVFPSYGKTGCLAEPKTAWKRILERAGIKDLRPHDLRRTLGAWSARTGASLPIIGKALGHRSQAATAVYARLDLDPVVLAINTATAAMLAAARHVENEHLK